MKWLVQEFLNNSSNYVRMVDALESLQVEYLIVHINQRNELSVVDKEHKTILEHSHDVLKEFTQESNVMVYGSKSLSLIAKDRGLTPGTFMNENFEFEVLKKSFGQELLNSDFQIGDLFTLQPEWNTFFIRPTGNTKLFTGMVVSAEEFKEWQDREEKDPQSPYRNQPLMISPIQEILSEFRFFVVDGKVVSGSSYRVKGGENTSLKASDEMLEYTQRMVEIFPLARAYVIDIADTKEGFKIVECNNINTSGLYNCNEYDIIKAINNMTFE